MKTFTLLVSVLLMVLISACTVASTETTRGSGVVVGMVAAVSDFDRIVMSGSGELLITQGDEESLSVEGEENIMDYVRTEVRDGTLYLELDTDGVNLQPTRPVKYTVDLKRLVSLEISGSGRATATHIDTERLHAEINGSGVIQIGELTAERLGVRLSGSGEYHLAGEVTAQDVHLSGSGQYKAGGLRSQTAIVDVSGSGRATVWATESLDIDVSGSGSVSYYGGPVITSHTSGSAGIHALGSP